jgi:hypothetical protein
MQFKVPRENISVQEFQRLYFLLGVASEAGTEEIAKNIEFLILKEIEF